MASVASIPDRVAALEDRVAKLEQQVYEFNRQQKTFHADELAHLDPRPAPGAVEMPSPTL